MKKLLIVEDEKNIRQGIMAMVQRLLVPVPKIILCKNGEEAFEIIKNDHIDVMITDIRMPKKDGITLVKEIQVLPHIPKIIVISGYDDFEYAVELMKCGAREYLLKPIEREKLKNILELLEEELRAESVQKNETLKIREQQFKYMLLNPNITREELEAINHKFSGNFMKDNYIVFCANHTESPSLSLSEFIFLEDINGQNISIVKEEQREELLNNLYKDCFVGVSKPHSSLIELKEAYAEALYARKTAFATENHIIEYKQSEDNLKEIIPEYKLEQFVQMVGADKLSDAKRFLNHILNITKQEKLEPDYFAEIMCNIIDKICLNYKNVLDFKTEDISGLKKVYEYDNASCYCAAVSNWIESINEKLLKEFNDYKNKYKVQKAIGYIQENYDKDLNMAIVSNYISMNYSLFSYVFKQYTDMNFVNYIKTIRINEAKRLLEKTDKKIIEISGLVGFKNEKRFTKTFKSIVGVSPTEYRKNIQTGNAEDD